MAGALALDELGLPGAIRQQAAALAGAGAPRFVLHLPDDLDGLPPAVEVAIYRIVAEATTNVVRHASASTCQVTVQAAAGLVHLRVADDGVGLLAEATGTGIPSMRGRAEELGGRWGVAAGPSGGCVVSAEIPIGTP